LSGDEVKFGVLLDKFSGHTLQKLLKTNYNICMFTARFPINRFFLILLSLFITMCVVSIAQAQTAKSNCWVTAIGNAPTPTFPPGCTDDGGVLPTPGDGTHPVAPVCPNDNCRQAVIDKFDVTISTSLPDAYAQYAWQRLWDVSNTNFDDLVRGTYVERDDSGSHRAGNTIYLRGTYNQTFFNIIFIHEMGHVINDMDDTLSKRTKHADLWYTDTNDGHRGVTGYGEFACTYSGPADIHKIEEDYADMLAYYLSPGAVDQTTGSCDRGVVPYADGKYPGHYSLAQEILGAY
jgi:hypothetical protein